MKFAVKNTKTPEQILLEKQINNQVVYIHTRKDKPGHVFYVGEGNAKRPYSKTRNSYWHKIVKNHGYKVHIIKTNLTVEESVNLEIKLTLAYKSIGMAEACLVIGGYGNKIYSEETKRKISLSNKNKIISDETRLKMRLARQNMSPENKQKILNANKNRVIGDETRLKLSIINKGRKHSDEIKKKFSIAKQNMSDETRLKMSIAAKNRSAETRLNMSDAQKGHIVSNETRLKLSIASKNISDETRLKMSIAAKNRSVSEATKLKMSIAAKNISDETRLKMSLAAKNRGSKPVQAYIGGEIISNFNSSKDAEFITGVKGINSVCNGRKYYKTSGIYDLENQKFVSLTPAQLKELLLDYMLNHIKVELE